MRKSRVIMATAVRQFEYENKKHLRQGALMRRRFLLNGLFGGWCICYWNSLDHPSPLGEGKGVGPLGVAQTYMPHPNPVEPLGPVRGTGPSTPEGEGLNFSICNAARLFRG